MAQLFGSFCISSQWACCSTFKYLANACCSSWSELQKPSTFPSSTCIDLLRGDSCMLFMAVISNILYVHQQYLFHAHSSMLWMYWHPYQDFRQDHTHKHCHVHYAKPSESCHDRNIYTVWSLLTLDIRTCLEMLYVFCIYPQVLTHWWHLQPI